MTIIKEIERSSREGGIVEQWYKGCALQKSDFSGYIPLYSVFHTL
jgi:hypothetical protein